MRRSPTGNPRLMKELNQSMILELIREHECISRADIAKELKLSPPTVSKIVNQLVADGWVDEIGAGESSGGRKPFLIKFNPRKHYAIGAYVGAGQIIVGLADLDGRIYVRRSASRAPGGPGGAPSGGATVCGREQAAPAPGPGQAAILDTLIRLIEEVIEEARIDSSKVCGIGVAVCGITRVENGTVVRARHLPGWDNFPVRAVLEERFGVPVVADNDVYLAVLGESWRGAGKGVRDLVLVTLGQGVGCGIIINGKVYRGSTGAAGEIGDMIVTETAIERAQEKGGYLEVMAGWSTLVEHAAAGLGAGAGARAGARAEVGAGVGAGAGGADRESGSAAGGGDILARMAGGRPDRITPELVFEAARLGDDLALDLVGRVSRYLAYTVANIISLLNPEVVIIGGDVAQVGEVILGPISDGVKSLLHSPPPILLSSLGRDAEILGAVAVAIERANPSLAISYDMSIIGAGDEIFAGAGAAGTAGNGNRNIGTA
ncbi:MAG: ROK family transcriptional regulator [Firmicutes bacterium]|nr:ROK family transcriptional regulator [Bacillota bacterium]